MPPVIEKEKRFHLDHVEKAKLDLVWLSCKNFEALSETANQVLLDSVWEHIKIQIGPYLQDYSISLDSIAVDFKKMSLTIDPKQPFGYEPVENVLIVNLWALFFSLTPDGFATPTPPWQTAGNLIHEHDHYVFVRDSGMIGRTKDEIKEFNEKHRKELEKRAYSIELSFLDNCKKNVSPRQLRYKIRNLLWTPNGKRIGGEIPICEVSAEAEIRSIDDAILQLREVIHKIDIGEYEDFSTQESIKDSQRMVELLSLPIELDPEKEYPKIEMGF